MTQDAETLSKISAELSLPPRGVAAVVKLLDEGNTVPFIARYRKEMTGSLDEVQIRDIQERGAYLTELGDRKGTILDAIDKQGKLTPGLRRLIETCKSKTALEDLYRPYKQKRRTRAKIARERGLEALADKIQSQSNQGSPRTDARAFVSVENEVPDVESALQGARDILAERISDRADVRRLVRDYSIDTGEIASRVAKADLGPTKFEQYYDYREPVRRIPSHRYLAVRRGENEKVLRVKLLVETESLLPRVQNLAGWKRGSAYAEQLSTAVSEAYKRLIAPSIESEIRVELKARSDQDAVTVFADNLKNLLLAAPLGERSVIGIDPGLRTGCKCAVVTSTGKFVVNTTIHPSQGARRAEEAKRIILGLAEKHSPFAIAVGNGTGGRETERFVRDCLKSSNNPALTKIVVVLVNEAGASVYSASDVARQEFADLDLTVRGAISIARRLQDPLAELVKVEPKAIGVGQYQHDVNQPMLQRKLDEVVESCVNRVGVDVNTASWSLLSYVAGIGPKLAKNIVSYRDENGAYAGRKQLLKVSGLGRRTFEQAAGFLRVRGGVQPLDASAVHPERYALVEKMAKDLGESVGALVGHSEVVQRVDIGRYVSGDVGEPTLRDIIAELEKPGRDPREAFEPPAFRDDVNEITDLKEGMQLEGVVTNVTHFGAFVDIGVHQDGLVHVSQLADRFVKDPNTVVKVGQRIKVRVLEVDVQRKRISLSARSEAPPKRHRSESEPRAKTPAQQPRRKRPERRDAGKNTQRTSRGQGQSKEALRHNPFGKLKN